MNGAAMYASCFQFAVLFVVQVEVGLHTSKGARHVVHHVIDQFIQIEDGRDFARPFLQLLEMLDLLELHGAGADRIVAVMAGPGNVAMENSFAMSAKREEDYDTLYEMPEASRRILF